MSCDASGPGERDTDVTGRVRVNSGTDSLSESMGLT